jgi:hypothetical protein
MSLKPRTVVITLVIAIFAPTLISLATNLYLDPFSIYRKASLQNDVFLGGRGRDRYQHAGVIQNYEPRAVVLGNSLSANFLPSIIEEKLGWKRTFSLTLDGGTIREQSIVGLAALNKNRIKNVLWLLAPYNFSTLFNSTNDKMPFPHYLYNSYRIDDLELFLTLPAEMIHYTSLKDAKREEIFIESNQKGIFIDSRDRSTEWASTYNGNFNHAKALATKMLGNFPNLESFQAQADKAEYLSQKLIASLIPREAERRKFENHIAFNILPLILAQPDTKFKFIILPPFPTLYWLRMKTDAPKRYKDQLAFIRLFVEKLSDFGNVEIYSYGLEPFTSDLRLYKDARHYHGAVNDYMVSQIRERKGLITSETINGHLQQFDRQVSSYKVEAANSSDVFVTSKQLAKSEAMGIINSYLSASN